MVQVVDMNFFTGLRKFAKHHDHIIFVYHVVMVSESMVIVTLNICPSPVSPPFYIMKSQYEVVEVLGLF